MKMGEHSVVFKGQDEVIFKHFIFAKKMWTHKGKYWLVTKDE